MSTLHACGVSHGDLREDNIRLDDLSERKVWLVNFGKSEKHTCAHQMIDLGGDMPDSEEFGCSELFQLGCPASKLWVDYGKASSNPYSERYSDFVRENVV